MRKYSKIYKHKSEDWHGVERERLFRYNYPKSRLEYICKPDEEMLDDIKSDLDSRIDWMRVEAKENLKSFNKTGYVIITSEMLNKYSWKQDKEYYMQKMSDQITCEVAETLKEFA